jgi:pimeloyl-ACP methyl ester carboxylesterase
MPALPRRHLVLIPGLLCNGLLCSDQISRLCNLADVEVSYITDGETITEMAETVLNSAPECFSLAGFSLGSQVALEIMKLAGDRVDRLALLSATRGGLLPPVATAIQKAILLIEEGGFEQYLELAYPTYVSPIRRNDSALKKVFLEMAAEVGSEAGIRQMRALLALDAPFSGLNEIHCPTIVIGGEEDRRTTPEAHQLLAQEIPDSHLFMVKNAAHFTLLERPAAVTDLLLDWLNN